MAGALTMGRAYFEEMYAQANDPWAFESSWYEQRKYALTLAALPRERYRRAFEPGCSNGVLSSLLAERCDELLAMDLLPSVVARARARLASHPGARVVEGAIPCDWPRGTFDLIVLSEVAYYLTGIGLRETLVRLRQSMCPGGTLVSVHYLLETNYPLKGRRVGEVLDETRWLKRTANYAEESFELLVYEAC